MKLNDLIKLKTKSKRRVGRGESSGSGKTAGRGAKGQNKRGKVAVGFEGGQLPLYKRLPQKRGIGNSPLTKTLTITTAALNRLKGVDRIDEKNLRQVGLLAKSTRAIKIKIVASEKLEQAFTVAVPTSKKAKSLIEKAGGRLLNEDSN